MNYRIFRSRTIAALTGTLLMTLLPFVASAQPGQIGTRALTPQDIKDYGLPADTQVSGGLSTVGVGQPAYLEAQVLATLGDADILGVTWELVAKPIGSSATLAPSPLLANMPVYNRGDREFFKVASRRLLRPDVPGQYRVQATVATNGGQFVLSREITGGTYLGKDICQYCHSGGYLPDMLTPWSRTRHARALTNALDGYYGGHFNQNCIKCHSVGYDTHVAATNGGFDDVQAQTGWTFPATLTPGNYQAMPEALRNKANVQCESCHGPGSEHAFALGNPERISVSFSAGDCAQCHDSKPYYAKGAEWANSGHAVATRTPTGASRASCVRCHAAMAFVDHLDGKPQNELRTAYEAITCAACHDPHGPENPSMLRTVAPVTLVDGTTVTNAGKGALCMNCHQSHYNAATYVETAAGGPYFGPHHGPQADMLSGVSGYTYGKEIPSSAHREVVADSCVTCHLQEVEPAHPAFGNVGGHTFRVGWDGGTPGDKSDDVALTGACVQCHGNITSFNLKRVDYDGNGVVEGVQTEVKNLLDQLGRLLPPLGSPTVTVTAGYTRQQLRAAFNHMFVSEDGSYGVHNVSYAVGLLKASIADLTGDGNNDGLADAWQIQYFGSVTHPDAAPNATPAGDGIPNWLKFALGLNPTVPGLVLPDGVIWANGTPGTGGSDQIQIFTAAEIVFHTEIGKNYQLQSISSLGGGWQNIGAPVTGTGEAYSFVTPTRNHPQQFYRVVSTP
ncbi:MAG TPA: cytochrome c3 family protein [Verrucomicrobiota bacterium]|nr:cytochrome c3 family protein [Verrucomicrobiota bacterium]HQB17372.1 cytochrome c3 family protein [Verrucomicrobiota bacterium]